MVEVRGGGAASKSGAVEHQQSVISSDCHCFLEIVPLRRPHEWTPWISTRPKVKHHIFSFLISLSLSISHSILISISAAIGSSRFSHFIFPLCGGVVLAAQIFAVDVEVAGAFESGSLFLCKTQYFSYETQQKIEGKQKKQSTNFRRL